jgi:signal transduction histidine kinase
MFMPDFSVVIPDAPYSFPENLLPTLLAVSFSAVTLLRPLYNAAGDQVVDFHLDYLNPAAQRLAGLPEQPGSTALTRFPSLRANGVFDFYVRTFRTGEPATFEVNYQADGFDNYFHLAAQRCGNLLVVSFTETSDQSRVPVEEALRESQALEQAAHAEAVKQRQRFREVLTQMPAYIAVYQGPDHIYQFINPAYQSLFPHRSFLGRPFREGTPESVELGVVALFDQVYQTGEPVYLREMEGWFDFHGNHQPVQVFLNISLHPLRNVQGDIDGVLDFTYDVSEQVRARRQVEQLNQELENRVQERTQELRDSNAHLRRTNADLDTFVYTASHDLKAPIINIEGLLLALRHDLPVEVLDGPLVPRLLDMMQGSVERFQQTIGHLSHIAQLQQAETTTHVNLVDLIENVQLDLAPLIEAASATLSVAVEDCATVRVAPKTLRSVVYNLLSNAVKYRAPERPAQVRLRAHCEPGHLVLAVQDNGLGLTEAQQGELFGVFRRLHTHVEGSGVGLFMVKRLIENAGGTITVQSQVEVGTTFTVVLPT